MDRSIGKNKPISNQNSQRFLKLSDIKAEL